MKAFVLAMLSLLAASPSMAQRPYTEKQVIAYSKSIDVHTLDPSLPSQRLEDWLQNGPPHAHIGYWEADDSCDLKDVELEFPNRDWPICVRIGFYRDGEQGYRYGQGGYLLVQVGDAKKGISGLPQLNQPFSVSEGANVLTGGSERLSDLPAILNQPVVTGVVQGLYSEIVANHPVGIPSNLEMSALRPYLSRRLAETFQAARACQEDYEHQQSTTRGSARPRWLKSGLFSGDDIHTMPVDAVAVHKEKQNDGSFLVDVDMEPKAAVIKSGRGPIAFHGGYTWVAEAHVVSEDGRFVVDNIRVFDRFPENSASYLLTDLFSGCDGSHWVGSRGALK